ncbi:MAG: sugar ABC transporter ATP-binding protein [Limisphaerales bacterium]
MDFEPLRRAGALMRAAPDRSRPAVAFREIEKRFPGVVALRGVSFDVSAGSCHALMGENGAGKSTLGKILAGIHCPDGGHIEIDGAPRRLRSPIEARLAGVGIVHQELALCPNLSVAENLCLFSLPRRGLAVDGDEMMARASRFLREVGADCDPREELGVLPTAQTQLVQIAAALATGARILVMDEPTSSLSLSEARRLEGLISQLRERGATILYVSHRMDEIFRVCDTVTVLRDGGHIATMPLSQTNHDDLVRMMIGRPLARYFPAHATRDVGRERLRVEGLSSPGKFRDVSFRIRAGEVLGMAGLAGSGRSEVALGIFGLDRSVTGRVFVEERPVRIRHPRQAMSLGIGLVGEDRKRQGLVPEMACVENVTLASLHCPGGRGFFGRLVHCPFCPRKAECLRLWDFIRLPIEREWVARFFSRLRVRAPSPEAPALTLSGGNQQKVILARCLARKCRILILDEPTRGVDVGAKAEIHRLIDDLASAGHAILMISSELPEVLNLSTRVITMRAGRVAGALPRAEATQETVMQLMAGRSGIRRPAHPGESAAV